MDSMEFNVISIAAALYDGGWRSTVDDYERLVRDYRMTQKQAGAICNELAAFAAD